MGSLSNLYISQSYQSLIHLATNNTASATLIDLQDGLGNSVGIAVNTSGNLYLSGSLTASLQQGYLYVGDANNKTYAFPTSSLVTNINTGSLVTTASFNAYTQSNDTKWSNLAGQSGSWVTSAITASSIVEIFNTITDYQFTYTKGDGSQQTVTLTAPAQTDITALNEFTASQLDINNGYNAFTQSQQTYNTNNDNKWSDLGSKSGSWITESETGSFARYDVSNPWSANQTFTNISAVSASFTYVQTTYETSSVIYSSGSNIFGDSILDTQTLNGQTKVSGSLGVTGSFYNNTLLYPTTDNGEKSFIQSNGAGILSLQYVDAMFETVRNMSGVTLAKGTPVYISGSTGDNGNAYVADASDALKMPASYILGEDLTPGQTGIALISGLIEGVNTTGYIAGTQIYVAEGGGWTSNRPSGSASIVQKLGLVTKEGIGGQGIVINQLEAELPNLQTGYAWVGNGSNQPVQVTTSSFIDAIPLTSLNQFTASQETKNTTLENVTASLQQFTQSADSRLDNLEAATSSYAISSSVAAVDALQQSQIDNLIAATASYSTSSVSLTSLNAYTQSNDTKWTTLGGLTGSYVTSAITASSLVTASVNLNTITFTKGDATTFNITVDTGSGGGGTTDISSLNAFTASQETKNTTLEGVTSSLQLYTASQNIINTNVGLSASLYEAKFDTIGTQSGSWGGGGSINTGSFATTGSNTFTGDQTFIDNGGNFFTITDASGSMMLVAKTFTSASAHISASASNQVNLIFKNNSNTPDTILSGSNNIFVNGLAPTAGFKRYIGGSNNIYNTTGLPQISGSMAISPTMNGNIGVGSYTFRGPVSSSTWTMQNNYNAGAINIGSSATLHAEKLTSGLNLSANSIQGGVTIVANQTALTGSNTIFANNSVNGNPILYLSSSAASLQNNIINDTGFTLTNQYYTGSLGRGQITVSRNTIGGSTNTILVTGIADAGVSTQPQFINNTMGGQNNIIFSNATGAGSNQSIASTIIFGQSLIVSASSNTNTTSTLGSAFLGRFNANDGIRNKASDIIVAVGTGTSTSNRKTGFLIDTNSNTFVEGTLNVSGSTILTGSIISVDRSGNATNTIIGLNALGMGNPGAQPLAEGNTISIAIGNGAMRFASGSSQNVAIGNNALLITTGSGNFALGSEALTNNTTGTGNIAIGQNALNGSTIGSSNIAIGTNAAFRTSGSFNTFLGDSSGYNITGSNNTILGRYQGSAGETFNNNIILADGSGNIKAQYSGSAWSLQDDIKFNKGTNKTTDIVSVNSTATITNSLVTNASIILVTTQNSGTGPVYPAVVLNKGTGTFDIAHNFAGALDVAYLIINPT